MFWDKKKPKRVYLDYVAGTPVLPEVLEEIKKHLGVFGNPGTIHKEGLAAKNLLADSRERFARAIFARDKEIIFTSGATESNNLAVLGAIGAWRKNNPSKKAHVIASNIEHPSVLEIFNNLEKEIDVTFVEVYTDGLIDPRKVRESLRPNTIFVSIISASNEIGTIQPIKEIAKEIRHFKKHVMGHHDSLYPILHTDASQAPLYLPLDMRNMGVDLMTLSFEKIGGLPGLGAFYLRSGIPVQRITFGGDQEFGLRPGTENVAMIAGFARALELAVTDRQAEGERLCEIQKYCFDNLENKFAGKFIINGSKENRLPNNVNITFPGFDSELLVIELDAKGVAVSEKSACSTDDAGSYVIGSLRSNDTGSIRISFGRDTTKGDIDYLVSCLSEIFKKYENLKK